MILRHNVHGNGPSDSILTLDFEGKRIRFVGTPEHPAWLAVDVCDVLGIVNASQATRNVYER